MEIIYLAASASLAMGSAASLVLIIYLSLHLPGMREKAVRLAERRGKITLNPIIICAMPFYGESW